VEFSEIDPARRAFDRVILLVTALGAHHERAYSTSP
jgi:hypothetical protein